MDFCDCAMYTRLWNFRGGGSVQVMCNWDTWTMFITIKSVLGRVRKYQERIVQVKCTVLGMNTISMVANHVA